MQRTEQKTAYFVKCDFCGREEECNGFDKQTMRHFAVCFREIGGSATMDICMDCETSSHAWLIFEKAKKVFEAMQPKQPHNADVEEWRR